MSRNGIELGNWQIRIGPGKASAKQVHGNRIVPIRELIPGKTEADGILIDTPSIKASIGFADCMPLVLAGRGRAIILHVSRKTLVAGLLDAVPEILSVNEIEFVHIGPHICADHFTFEWEGQGIQAFTLKFPGAVQKKGDLIHLSLLQAVLGYFTQWNIGSDKITQDGRCTYETLALPSWKRHSGQGKALNTLDAYTVTLWHS